MHALAGHRHRVQCRRHRHSGILHLSPVPEHSVTGLGPLISVKDCPRHRHFNSFRNQTDLMPYSPTSRHLKKVKKDTPCTSLLTSLKRDTPCMSIVHSLHCFWRRWIHPARPYCTDEGVGSLGWIHPAVHTAGSGKGYTLREKAHGEVMKADENAFLVEGKT